MNSNYNIKILLVDDHPLILDGLTLALQGMFQGCEIKTAETTSDALQAIEEEPMFDWLFIDVLLPERGGIELLKMIRHQMIASPVVMMSGVHDPAVIRQSIEAGANGFLPKHMRSSVLRECMQRIEQGQVFLPEHIRQQLVEYETGTGRLVTSASQQLSDKQKTVLALLSKGYSNAEIGESMGLAESTVKFHVSKTFSILNVDNRTKCVAVAREMGIIEDDAS